MPFLSFSTRLAGIVRDALGVLAGLGPKGVATGPVLVAIHRCIQLRLTRFERLMARVAAGDFQAGRAPVVRRSGAAASGRGAGATRARRVSLVPRGHAWAVKMAQGTAAFGSQLQALLAEPEVLEILARVPEAAAILRPLCRMLATPVPDVLQPAGWAPKVERPRPPPRRQPRFGEDRVRFNARRERWEPVPVRDRKGRFVGRWPP